MRPSFPLWIGFLVVALSGVGLRGQTAPPSLLGIVGGGSVELGQRVVLQANFSGTGTGQTYQWRRAGADIVGATNVSYVIDPVAASDAGTYAVSVSNAAGSSVATTEVVVKPAAAPVITTQPRAQVAPVGQTVIFSFVATGSFPRTHQWRKDGVDISGATNATLTLTSITTSDAGVYSVQVSNSLGSATSTSASLTVNAATPPVITSFAPGDATFTQGQNASLGVSLSGGSGPVTYQWLKSGVPIAGATGAQLTFAAVTLADAGRYSVTATNVAGSATSREATVTVIPATPVSLQRGPESLSVAQGQTARFFVSVTGSPPFTYQWSKDGTVIPGATNSEYSLNAVTSADAASYTVSIANVLGTVTSSPATLTVTPAVPPSITTHPASQTLPYNGNVTLNVQASGTPPFTYQWRKDGTPISGAISGTYFLSNLTPAQSGVYTVVVTNGAGSVTSNGATITVNAPAAPVITQQPAALEVATGLGASFSVSVNANGAGSLTYQWLKNGAPIAGANSAIFGFSSVRLADAGDYSVTISGPGGTVTSAVAKLTILPPAPPSVRGWPTGSYTLALGSSGSMSFDSVSGTGPFAFQWSKNGAPIAGATNSSLQFPVVSAGDVGTYTVTISNEGGVITSPGLRLRVYEGSQYSSTPAPPPPWLEVGQVGSIVYFLATLPGRIERYDLAAERWLPTTLLSETQVPTAFAPADDGVYLAYGRVLARRPLDLSSETPLTNTASNVSHMFVFGNFLYFNSGATSSSGNYSTLHRSTLQPGPAASLGRFSSSYRQVSLAPSLRRGFGTSTGYSPSDIEAFTIAADGSISGSGDAPYHGTMPIGSRTFVLPGDQFVTDDAGTVYRTSDLVYAGSFGEPFTDLAFFSDGTPVVLRQIQLSTTRSDNFLETGRVRLLQAGLRVFARGTNAFVFGPPGGAANFAVTKVGRAEIVPVATPAPRPLPTTRYSVDDAFLGEGNIVYVFSRTLQGFIRWNPTTRSFLPTLPLRDAPGLVFHQPGNPRALAYYPDGVITEIPLRADATERPLANIGHYVRAITDLGDMFTVNFSDWQSSGDDRFIFTATGPRLISTNLYNALGLAWQPASRRLYSIPAFSGTLQFEGITAAGTLATPANTNPASTSVPVTPPIRFNAENTLLVTTNGRVLNADLASVGVLANNVADAAWLSNGLFTIRRVAGETEVQQWSRFTYLQAGSVTVRGTPVRLLRLSDAQLLVVSSLQGFLTFTLVNSDLSVVAPPEIRTLAGVYFAKLSPAGDLALLVRSNGTGTLLASLSGTRTAIFSNNVTVNSDGSFIVSATDLASGGTRTIAGNISADGAFTGSIPNLNLSFAGARVGGSGTTGFYQASAVNGGIGSAYAIVAPDGRGVVVAQSVNAIEGGSATSDAAGRLPLVTSTGAQLTFEIDAAAGTIGGSADRDAFGNVTFAGVRDDVVRTDRLGNISTRGRAGAGGDAMIAGFVIAGTAPRPVLIRAIGPALGNFGIVGALADPKLTLYRGGTQLAESDNWSSEPNASAIATVSTRVGAFALPVPGRDAVLLSNLEAGSYTAQITAASGSGGVSLVEVYDAGIDGAAGTPKLINIATRGRVGSGEDVLIAGIVVTGNAPKRILVRAIGPTLGLFGVDGVLADPVLTIISGGRTLSINDDWSNPPIGVSASEIAATAVSVGAFALPASSRDAALLITLQPGNYTAQVSGKGSATGVTLVEIYEANN